MKITPEKINHVAGLARLTLHSEETVAMAGQLDRILNYIDKLDELDTAGIEPTFHALSIQNAFRRDEVRDSLSQEQALSNGPEQNGIAFVVPLII
jgi:aspartyl-tRNA(Asn)/glutamyl-tRNA(Gln) amidotransferase subunit C